MATFLGEKWVCQFVPPIWGLVDGHLFNILTPPPPPPSLTSSKKWVSSGGGLGGSKPKTHLGGAFIGQNNDFTKG